MFRYVYLLYHTLLLKVWSEIPHFLFLSLRKKAYVSQEA